MVSRRFTGGARRSQQRWRRLLQSLRHPIIDISLEKVASGGEFFGPHHSLEHEKLGCTRIHPGLDAEVSWAIARSTIGAGLPSDTTRMAVANADAARATSNEKNRVRKPHGALPNRR